MKRIPSLDGLRAISITLVVLHHLARGSTAVWGAYGRTGVEIFFVISGFLITTILLREKERTDTIDLREFYVRRAFRIFPAAYTFMLAGMAICWGELRWPHVATTVLYLSNFDPGRPWIFGHMWSLSVEEQFYVLWPGVLRRWYRHRITILISVVALSLICDALLRHWHIRGRTDFFPVVAYSLAIGCLLAMFAPKIPRVPPFVAVLALPMIVLIPLYQNADLRGIVGWQGGLLIVFILQPLLCIAIAVLILHVVQVPYRFLNWRPVVWIGVISYSLYLWQEPFCPNPRFSRAAAVLLSIGAASISHYVVERPMLRVREWVTTNAGKLRASRSSTTCRSSATQTPTFAAATEGKSTE